MSEHLPLLRATHSSQPCSSCGQTSLFVAYVSSETICIDHRNICSCKTHITKQSAIHIFLWYVPPRTIHTTPCDHQLASRFRHCICSIGFPLNSPGVGKSHILYFIRVTTFIFRPETSRCVRQNMQKTFFWKKFFNTRKWIIMDLNHEPSRYERDALTVAPMILSTDGQELLPTIYTVTILFYTVTIATKNRNL